MDDFLNNYIIWIMTAIALAVPAYALITNKFVIGKLSLNNALVVGDKVIYCGSMEAFQNRVNHSRISICQLESGKDFGKLLLHRGDYYILIAFDGVVWVRPQSLALDARPVEYNPVGFELSTLKILSDAKQLRKQFDLKQSEKLKEMRVDLNDNKLNFISNSGNNYSIDYNMASTTIPSEWPSRFIREFFPDPYGLVKKPGTERFEFTFNKKTLGCDSFLNPVLVNEFYETDVHAGFVFYHLQTLDKHPAISISLMGLDGKLRWTVEQAAIGMHSANQTDAAGHVIPLFAGSNKSTLVYAIKARRGPSKLFAIDSTEGKLIWIKSI